METPEQAIRDFLAAVDRGYLGQMPSGFNDSAFVKALRVHAGAERETCPEVLTDAIASVPYNPRGPARQDDLAWAVFNATSLKD